MKKGGDCDIALYSFLKNNKFDLVYCVSSLILLNDSERVPAIWWTLATIEIFCQNNFLKMHGVIKLLE